MELDIVAPRSAQHYPAILYMTGLAGLLPSYFQSTLIDAVAEQGYVFITVTSNTFRFLNCKAPTLKR